MQNDQQDPKEFIIERIQQATNILVTVENNPSVDELAAALSLTLMLNKMDKHATAVFSGAVPPAISFLEPKKTFESSVDSLRDFIIALDKEKADRLRYKVEDDVVKIFITPYRSVISEKDLQFSQGDFNVEVIVALGVEKREDLDRAIMAHGRILHDATVVTINARDDHSSLGSVDWQDQAASSICEMLSILGEDLKVPKLFDQQISTALLTGIVAATDRFSNEHTSPRVMNVAAQLMASGANQQLIAVNLTEKVKEAEKPKAPNASQKIIKEEGKEAANGEMKVSHEAEEKKEESPATSQAPAIKTASEDVADLTKVLEEAANKAPATPAVSGSRSKLADTPTPLIEEDTVLGLEPEVEEPAITKKKELRVEPPSEDGLPMIAPDHPSWRDQDHPLEHPTMSGTFNATTSEAEEDNRRATENEANNRPTILSHSDRSTPALSRSSPLPLEPPATQPPLPTPPPPPSPIEPDNYAKNDTKNETSPLPTPAETTKPEKPEVSPEAQRASDLDAARQAINDALLNQPFDPAGQPRDDTGASSAMTINHAPSPPLPTPSIVNPLPPPPPIATISSTPPLPDFTTLPPLPPLPTAAPIGNPGLPTMSAEAPHPQSSSGTLPPSTPPLTPPSQGNLSVDPNDPNLFHVPGQ